MEKSYSSVHDAMHEHYLEGRNSKVHRSLGFSARSMLDKATIIKNIKTARVLRQLCDEKIAADEFMNNDDFYHLYKLLSDCFEVIVDDVILMSAFEMLIKGRLLAKGYVIHEISKPKFLKDRQKKSPIHIRTIKSLYTKGEEIKFSQNTIGINYLVKEEYLKKTNIPKDVLDGLEKTRTRRNLVHFRSVLVWDVDKDLLKFVEYLNNEIPKC